jgi:peptide-methionine (R)-S-oxide reductase
MIYVGVGCESFGTAVNTNMAGNPSDTTKTQNWKELSPEQYKVCHDKATEAPFSGKYDNHYEKGIYYCAVCKTPLFSSETKFKSGTGWPSFYNEIDTNVSTHTDSSYNMIRDEIVCNKCGTAPIYSNKIKESFCKNCGSNSMNIIETPYCFKLLTQEFEAMGIQMRFNCDYTNIQVEEDFSDDDIIIGEDIDEDEPKDVKVELKFKDKFANVPIKELIAKIKAKYPTMKGLSLKKRPELIAILEGLVKDEVKKEVKDEVKKEVKKLNDKSTKKDIIDAVKNKYPNMKGIEKMKKEDLLELLNKDNIVEIKKEVKKNVKTIVQIKEEVKKKYPTFKFKSTMKKEDLIKILEMTDEEFDEYKNKKGGGLSDNLDDGLSDNLDDDLNDNLDDGLSDNLDDGLSDNLDDGLSDNLDDDLDDDLNDNLDDGLSDNLDDGLDDGLNDGLNDGLDDGLSDNLDDGLSDGLNYNKDNDKDLGGDLNDGIELSKNNNIFNDEIKVIKI